MIKKNDKKKTRAGKGGNGKALLVLLYAALVSFLFAPLYLGTCALPMGLGYLTGGNERVESVITGEDLQRFIPAPVTGDEPRSQFNAGGYSGVAAWTDDGGAPVTGAFLAGTVYAAAVTLSAHTGYTFRAPAAPNPGCFTHSRSEELSCAGGNGSTLEIDLRFGATTSESGKDYTVEYNLQRYVPVPVAGEAPVTGLSQSNLELTVQWQGAEGVNINAPAQFEEGTQYRAIISLRAQEPYLFNKNYAFAYPDGTVAAQPAPQLEEQDRVLSVVYLPAAPSQGVTDGDLTPHISVPGTGETAEWSIVASQFMGTVAWEFRYPESDPAAWTPMPGALFQPGAVYRAVVTLYAAAGYTLQDAAFFHDGGEINESGTAGASLLKELKIAFPATEKLPVADLDLTSKVPLPMPGESPVSSFASLEYTGDVVWTDEDSEEPVEGFFKAETVYSAEVNLTVTSGYTFNGAAAPAAAVSRSVTTAYIGFTHGEGETVDAAVMGDDSARVKIAFPKTASAPPEPVTDLILTSKVPAPVADKLPVWYFTVPQYTGLVEWYPEPSSGGFTVNRPYRAQVTLKAAPGWTFKGMEGPFVHGGADPAPALQPNPDTTVDNPGVTATITIAFPPATEPPFQWGISDNDLTNKVFRPEARATPATWVETQEYGGWVEWYTTGDHTPHTGSFGSGVAYTAEIRLMSSSGNTFYDNDGSLTPFTHTGVSYEPKDISTSVRQIILIIIDFEETK